MRGVAAGVLAGLALLVALSRLAAPSVGAHGELREGRPAPGSELDEAPDRVDLWFTEPLDPNQATLSVTDASGSEMSVGAAGVDPADGTHLSALLQLDLPGGAYTVSWHVVSAADGHPAIGGYTFAVAGVAPAAGEAPEEAAEVEEPGEDTRLPVIYWSLVVAGALAVLGLGVYYVRSGGLHLTLGGVQGGLVPPGEAGHDPTQAHH